MKKSNTFIRTNDMVWIPVFSGNDTNDTIGHIPAEFEYMRDLIEEEYLLDKHADMEQMVAFDLHQQKKHSHRYNRQKRRTSSRDKRGTLKAQYWEHSEKLYNRGERRNKLLKAHTREAKAVANMMELPVSDTMMEALASNVVMEPLVPHIVIQEAPWNNDALVLLIFDECAKRFVRDVNISIYEIFDLEMLRTYFELGKCRLAFNPYFNEEEEENPSTDNFLRLVIDEDARDLLSNPTFRVFLSRVVAKLYELNQHDEAHVRYLTKLMN